MNGIKRFKYLIGFIGSQPVLLGLISKDASAIQQCAELEECGYYPVLAYFACPPGTKP